MALFLSLPRVIGIIALMDDAIPNDMLQYAQTTIYYLVKRQERLSKQDREDFQQHALMKLAKNWHLYNTSKSTPKSFIAMVLKRALLDCLRKWQREQRRRGDEVECDEVATNSLNASTSAIAEEYVQDERGKTLLELLMEKATTREIARELHVKCKEAEALTERFREAMKRAMETGDALPRDWDKT